MTAIQSARKILDTLNENQAYMTVRRLAKASGFGNSRNRKFKEGLEHLSNAGIIKKTQSGWRSEKREGLNHPKAVILLSNIYAVEEAEITEAQENLPTMFTKQKSTALVTNEIFRKHQKQITRCKKCKISPFAFLTKEQIPICINHWYDVSLSLAMWWYKED